MHVLILSSQDGDWEGLFINGKLIDEAHTLGEGHSQLYMLRMAEKYFFKADDVQFKELIAEDDLVLMDSGGFPDFLEDLTGKY